MTDKHRPLSLLTRVVRGGLLWLYRRQDWEISGSAPAERRCVLIGAPHTSNWDFLFFMGVTAQLGIRPRFMGKSSLFHWPMRRFMLEMGGVPVVRSSSQNYVDAMVAEFGRHDDFMLVIAPEGTRGAVGKWRSGFYHIALGAGVPVVPGWVDHAAMKGGLGPPIRLSGDYEADMAKIAGFYESVMPGHPKLSVLTGQAAAAHG
jgi:1-acyl-sn-glycerol-3-phosphate acyltransferase